VFILFGTSHCMAQAYDANVGGVYYKLNQQTKEATVVSAGTHYSGAVHIPDNFLWKGTTYKVTSIGEAAFYFRNGITEITLPSTIRSIGNRAFSICVSLTSIVIPSSVTSIGAEAFSSCSALTSIEIPQGITSLEPYVFNACRSLSKVVLHEGITSIGASAFRGCSNLPSIILPDGVTTLGDYAFSDCFTLQEISLPSSMESVGRFAFCNCYQLLHLYNASPYVPQTATKVFDGTRLQAATLHVPDDDVTIYRLSAPWNEFGAITSLGETELSILQPSSQHAGNSTAVYDLTGRRLAMPPARGFYIQNHTKWLVP